MIRLENVTKIYPSAPCPVTALDDISLTIEDGAVFGVIGLSGAGKSTLVRCINLLERPTEGRVIVDGEDITLIKRKKLNELRRNIGMIFQNFNLLEQRTVLANVRFPLELAHAKRAYADQKAKELLELVGLSDKLGAYPSQLSGGQKQRVAIARALAMDPRYLLCDEATSALDPSTTSSILQLLKQINRTMDVTLIVITHEMQVVESICTHVAVITEGKIAECGTISEVFAYPRSETARKLLLPELAKQSDDKFRLRLIFDGSLSDTPVISGLAMDCKLAVNILFANTKSIDGKALGQMVIELPDDAVKCAEAKSYLLRHGVKFEVI